MPISFRLIPAAVLTTLFAGCETPRTLPTADRVDLSRYSGKWYEVARVKNRFQKNDESAVAEYMPINETTVQVRNTATSRKGKTRSITGVGEVVPESEGARLRVKFGGLAALAPVPQQGNYWIIDLDPKYQSALVGTPNRKYLWILARTPFPSAGTLNSYMTKAERLGFPMEKMIWDRDLGTGTPSAPPKKE